MKIEKIQLEHPIFSNCYLLVDEASGQAAIVDPGWYGDAIKNALRDANADLYYILLTHGHFDHISGTYDLKKDTGAAVVIHENDSECLLDPNKSLAHGNLPQDPEPVNADILVADGDIISLGESQIKVMHTPGHTKGGVCYILEDDRVILSGDTLFCRTVGRTDFHGGSTDDMNASIRRLIALDGDYRVLPGHNRETTLDSERISNHWIRRMNRK